MKFVTKELYYSIQFYDFFLAGIEEKNLLKENKNIQKKYVFYINRDFNQYIYEYERVKSILFDNNGNLCKLNIEMYYELLEITNKFKQYEEEQFFRLKKLTQDIQSSNYADDIKYLAQYNYHDCNIVDVSFNKSVLTIEFNNFYIEKISKYIFKTNKIVCNFPLEKIKEFQVLYEEVIHNSKDNTYEYNLLLIKWKPSEQADQIEEISIIFSEIVSITHKEY